MDVKTVTVFMGLAVFGVLFGALIPDNGCKNALKVLLSLVVTAALISTLTGLDILQEGGISLPSFDVSSDSLYDRAGTLLAEMTEAEVSVLVEEFTGYSPRYVKCYTRWSGEGFELSGLVVACRCENPDSVRTYLASKLGVFASLINVTE